VVFYGTATSSALPPVYTNREKARAAKRAAAWAALFRFILPHSYFCDDEAE
jgi:hypothetical protein